MSSNVARALVATLDHVASTPGSVAARNNAPMSSIGAVLVLPNTTAGKQGPVPAWLSTAGWASAVRRVLGAAWISTPEGLVDPDEARRRGSHPRLTGASPASWRRRIPTVVKTAVKDGRRWWQNRRFHVDPDGPWRAADIRFVWQRHELFQFAGLELARALGKPSVLFAPAPLVWESAQWGIRRPGWGQWLERHGEQRAMRDADLIACGSEMVADRVRRLGIRDDRLVITPTGVDLDLFADRPDPGPVRRRLGLDDHFVIGWVGSFRRFHALDQAVDAAARIDNAALLMVGDGPERSNVEQLARERGVSAVFTGTVPFAELSAYRAAMDVALLLAEPDSPFHYSPLKLAEYLAAGLPVIAPRVAQCTERLRDGVDALLVAPGDVHALCDALVHLRDDPDGRAALGVRARTAAEKQWSWDEQVRKVLSALA
jgi:glycosyltransferase involved in cell wall biosynthesis